MSSVRENRIIIILLCSAIVLISLAFFTINRTFAYEEPIKNWNVYYGKVENKYDNLDLSVNNESLNFSVVLSKFGESYRLVVPVVNDGDYDAYIDKLQYTNLKDLVVGTSNETNHTYTVSDYIDFTIRYNESNKENEIVKMREVSKNDLLKRETTNYFLITVHYKDLELITDDMLDVLKRSDSKVINENYEFNLNLSVSTNFQEYK